MNLVPWRNRSVSTLRNEFDRLFDSFSSDFDQGDGPGSTYDEGVLEIRIPKSESANSGAIPIKTK